MKLYHYFASEEDKANQATTTINIECIKMVLPVKGGKLNDDDFYMHMHSDDGCWMNITRNNREEMEKERDHLINALQELEGIQILGERIGG